MHNWPMGRRAKTYDGLLGREHVLDDDVPSRLPLDPRELLLLVDAHLLLLLLLPHRLLGLGLGLLTVGLVLELGLAPTTRVSARVRCAVRCVRCVCGAVCVRCGACSAACVVCACATRTWMGWMR